jgi:glycosyltransferase involved in cell wall biosynthesis
MPVFNGAATIKSSIECLLAQTFGDFELVVSDNASTDSTGDVVRELAARDGRIRYLRQSENIGVNRNYTFVARVSRGEYLKWASASDWCAPTLLERCLAALEQESDAVLAAPRTRLFQSDLSEARDYPDDVEILDDTPLQRFHHLLDSMRLNNAMNGLIRQSALRRTNLLDPYQGSDLVMMGHLALLGKFRLIDARLLYRRMDPAGATALQDAATVRHYHYPTPSAGALFQHARHHLGWFRTVATAPMPVDQRLKALARVARGVYWGRRGLVDDLQVAWEYAKGTPSTPA